MCIVMEMTNMFLQVHGFYLPVALHSHSQLTVFVPVLFVILHFYKWIFRPRGDLKYSHSSEFKAPSAAEHREI